MNDDLEPLDPRLRSYLRSRAEVLIPPDLSVIAFDRVRQGGPRSRVGFGRRWATVSGIAAALLIAAISFTLGSRPPVPPTTRDSPQPSEAAIASPDRPPSPTPTTTSGQTATDDFPTSVMEMPVVSLAEAKTLLNEGRLDGRAVAVKGYWINAMVSKPVFSSVGYVGQVCTDRGNGQSECHGGSAPPGAETLSPVLVDDTAAQYKIWSRELYEHFPDGYPVVLVGHANDPRSWQCPADTRAQCRRQFMVDRVAWFVGREIALTTPEGEVTPASPSMSMDEIRTAVGSDDLLTAWVGVASGAPAIDPRFHRVRSDVTWIVRSLRPDDVITDPTRAVDVWLVDDATGGVQGPVALDMPVDYQPGRFRPQAVLTGRSLDDGAYFMIETKDGLPVQELFLDFWQEPDGRRLLRADMTAVLEPGTYVVRASQTSFDVPSVEHPDECTTEFDLDALEDLRLEAAFDGRGPCVWREPTFDERAPVTQ
jgi:hypothetical protein